jgi:hypothetical protein
MLVAITHDTSNKHRRAKHPPTLVHPSRLRDGVSKLRPRRVANQKPRQFQFMSKLIPGQRPACGAAEAYLQSFLILRLKSKADFDLPGGLAQNAVGDTTQWLLQWWSRRQQSRSTVDAGQPCGSRDGITASKESNGKTPKASSVTIRLDRVLSTSPAQP